MKFKFEQYTKNSPYYKVNNRATKLFINKIFLLIFYNFTQVHNFVCVDISLYH